MDKIITKMVWSQFRDDYYYIGFGRIFKNLTVISPTVGLIIYTKKILAQFKIDILYIDVVLLDSGEYPKICKCRKCEHQFLNMTNNKRKNVRCRNCQKCSIDLSLLTTFEEYFNQWPK